MPSDPLRVALAVEGPTDFVVLRAVIGHLLEGREVETVPLQPESSEAFRAQGSGGWTALYSWCRATASQAGGSARNNPLFCFYDMLVVQVDADVAEKCYSDDRRIIDPPDDLPCVQPCPPASATTDLLRQVILGWLGETEPPPRTVLCTPSKSLETWILVALFPENRIARRADVECHAHPERQLQTQPKAKRMEKKSDVYERVATDIIAAWPTVRARCTEAERFSSDVLSIANPIGTAPCQPLPIP